MSKNSSSSESTAKDRLPLLETELEALYHVSRVLNRSLKLRETLREVLKVLNDAGHLLNGMVSLLDEESGDLLVSALHGNDAGPFEAVRYRPGEGIVGRIMQQKSALVLERLGDEPRFLDRLGIYDGKLPFIGVPIMDGSDSPVGVLAAQPRAKELLPVQGRFMEMVANLAGQSIRLAHKVESERHDLEKERDSLRRRVKAEHGFSNMVGHTQAMRRVFEQVRQVAKWNTTVLLRGESGTGKELVANAIHYHSQRTNGSFVKLNCAALPDNLLESELFGHEKGAFTGAVSRRKGRFEQANGGTLFLDEIGEISPAFQAKLLRVLQEGEFERVGGTATLSVDVRIIAATNRDLEQALKDGEFREDLYYRLNVMPILIPPLRERLEDIPELACFLVNKIAKRHSRQIEISDSALRSLLRYRWPGNVRELENTLERACIFSSEGVIDNRVIDMLGINLDTDQLASSEKKSKVDLNDPNMDERDRIIAALEEAGWVQAKAARLLNMTPRQIAYRIQTLNITVRQI